MWLKECLRHWKELYRSILHDNNINWINNIIAKALEIMCVRHSSECLSYPDVCSVLTVTLANLSHSAIASQATCICNSERAFTSNKNPYRIRGGTLSTLMHLEVHPFFHNDCVTSHDACRQTVDPQILSILITVTKEFHHLGGRKGKDTGSNFSKYFWTAWRKSVGPYTLKIILENNYCLEL